MNTKSLTLRLVITFASASTGLLLGLGFLLSNIVERHFEELDVDVLTGKLELAKHALANVRTREELDSLPRRLDAALIGHSGLSFAIGWPNGPTLFAIGEAEFPKFMFERGLVKSDARPKYWKNQEGKQFTSIATTAALGFDGAPETVIAVALEGSNHLNFIAKFKKVLWSFIFIAVIVNGVTARLAVSHALAPIRGLRQKASGINADHLDYRLAEDSVPFELQDLVKTLNAMLGRLENSFKRLSDFSSDLAHELRTPVSNILMQTEVTLSRGRTADEYKETLYSNAEECTRLSRMISDMLFLAKTDYSLIKPFTEVIDLEREVNDVFSYFEGVAESKNVQLQLVGHGSVLGDRMLLRRAIINFLSNAIRHTPESGVVRVFIDTVTQSGALILGFENTGEPIPSEHLSRLFDRFYRVDASRKGSSEGAGLGLAIAKSIIVLHGGTVAVQSAKGITRFAIRFPHDHISKS